jgi:kynurenine formamidase
MKITDLTHNIEEGMPVYPGTEPPEIKIATTVDNDGFEERLLTMFSHTGTHMDAPCHIVAGRKSLSDFDISDFTGKAVLIDVRDCKGSIGVDTVEKYADKLKDADFAVLFSGWDKLWGDVEYFDNFPVLTHESAQRLVSFGLKGIAMDMISIDPADTETFDNHKLVFNEDMLVVENLTKLENLPDVFEISFFPLKIRGGDGSPVRAVGRY